MKFEDDNFEEEFLNCLSNESNEELIESLEKYKKTKEGTIDVKN